MDELSAMRFGRNELRDDAVTVHHQDALTAGRKADVFTEFVLEDLEADGAHESMVATGSYLVKPIGTAPQTDGRGPGLPAYFAGRGVRVATAAGAAAAARIEAQRTTHAATRLIAPPISDSSATCSFRTSTPRSSATTGMK